MNFKSLFAFASFCVCFLLSLQFVAADIVCPAEQPDDSLVVQFPSATNCSQFYKCDRGTPFVMDCPNGLEYNAALEVCDYPENANCHL